MTPKKFHLSMIVAIFLIGVVFFGVTYWLNNTLISKANSLVQLKATYNGLTQEQSGLIQDKKDIAKYQNLYQIAKSIVPENKDQVQAVRQIVNLAAQNNVTLASITFPSSSLGNTLGGSILPNAAAPKPTTPAPPSSSKSAPTPSSPSSTASNPSLSQLSPVVGIPGVYELPITVQSSTTRGQQATYPEIIGFLTALENNRLTALVSSINISPIQNTSQYFSFTLNINIYIKPGS